MVIPFQNENLAAYIERPDGSRKVLPKLFFLFRTCSFLPMLRWQLLSQTSLLSWTLKVDLIWVLRCVCALVAFSHKITDNNSSQDSYGLRVTGMFRQLYEHHLSKLIIKPLVIALAGSPLWTTETGLKCGGPSAFGYVSIESVMSLLTFSRLSDSYVPIGEYVTPKSVIKKYKAYV